MGCNLYNSLLRPILSSHFFFFFFGENLSSFVKILILAYYLVWSMVHAYMPYGSMRRGDCSLICIKLGSITPCSFRIRLLIWHTLCVGCTCTVVQPIKNKSRSDEDSYQVEIRKHGQYVLCVFLGVQPHLITTL